MRRISLCFHTTTYFSEALKTTIKCREAAQIAAPATPSTISVKK
jgi:hypothetical protein